MKVPFSWLKEYVEIDVSAERLEELLFSCGFEVEELVYLGKNVENVVTGRITKCEKHPDADRLTICEVDFGELGTRQICTAATNVFAGAVVPCALDGATVLHEGGVQKIKTGKLRGALSEGMFCSGEELGINNDFYEGAEVNGILLLDEDTPLGADIRPIVGIDDFVFDIAVTANRPDCQSVYGMAREVAALLKKPLKPLIAHKEVWPKAGAVVSVEVYEPKLCPRYIGHYVKDVAVGVSPQWMRRRLALVGLRSVNNIVDITNYVLVEVGQPMHAFDRKFLRGNKIVVRRAEAGEKITTLDEKEFTLTPENLLICDGERPVALAGVMGGLNSEIKADTQEVFFEAASFARDSVRKTSRALGQRSESSARFEKGVDALWTPVAGIDRALALVKELGCGAPTSYGLEVINVPILDDKIIEASYAQIDEVLGIHVPKEEVNSILRRLGFEITDMGATFEATVPPYRQDIEGYPDLAEEVIRMYGYDHIAPTFLENATVTRGGLDPAQRAELHFKEALCEEGFSEAIGYSFYSPKDFDLLRLPADAPERAAIRVKNPLGEDLSVMRTILTPTMLANVVRNVRRGNDAGRLFELANVYHAQSLPLEELPEERKHVSLALWGEGDFFDVKGALESVFSRFGVKAEFVSGEKPYLHPGITATIMLGGRAVGFAGELHPSIAEELALEVPVFLAEVDYAALSENFAGIAYHPIPAFPAVRRDLAVVVDEAVTCAQLEACILHACKAVTSAELFDVYHDAERLGAGKKSMAFRLTFTPDAAAEKGLSPETVDGWFHKIVGNLSHLLGAELR